MIRPDQSSQRYGGFSDLDLAAWRFVRDQGGYWSGRELLIELPELGSPVKAAYRLKRLHSAGHMVCIPAKYDGDRNRYGVTTTCTAPPSEQLQPVSQPINGTNESIEDSMNQKTTPAVGETAAVDNAMARLGLSQSALAALLTPEQITQQVDLAQRLLGMAINGTPPVDRNTFPNGGVDLALHALLTAYMSLADAYEPHTQGAAYLAAQASVSLDRVHNARALRAPAQVQ